MFTVKYFLWSWISYFMIMPTTSWLVSYVVTNVSCHAINKVKVYTNNILVLMIIYACLLSVFHNQYKLQYYTSYGHYWAGLVTHVQYL